MPPIMVFSALEEAVRRCWPSELYIGVDVAIMCLLSLAHGYLHHPSLQLLECITNSSKSPPLLSVLLSCLKRLHYSFSDLQQQLPVSAEFACAIACAALGTGGISVNWIDSAGSSNRASAVSSHTPSSIDAMGNSSSSTVLNRPGSSSSSSTAGTTTTTTTISTSTSTTTTSTSTSSCATLSSFAAATGKGDADPPLAESQVGAVWLLLCGRCLFTAGIVLQAAQHIWQHPAVSAAQLEATAGPAVAASLLQSSMRPTCPAMTLPELQRSLELVVQLLRRMANQTVPAGDSVRGRQQSQVVLCVGPVSEGVIAAGEQLLRVVSAAVIHVNHLKAETAAAGGQADGTGSSAGQLWHSVLCSEQGQQLPEGLKHFGRLLSAALPSRCCCNEPSCCCLDQVSELQLASGKGSKCSGCGVARYCGVADQKQHWKLHKAVCRALAGHAPAASAAGKKKTV